jgi:uncharacterized RDD family membrane protein YckC
MVLSLVLELFIPSPDQATMALVGNILFLITFFLYYVFMEYKYQKSIGKLLTKTKVVTKDGRKPELNEMSYRTASRLIPFDRVSFLVTTNGFRDRFSNTTVVKDEKEKTNGNIL